MFGKGGKIMARFNVKVPARPKAVAPVTGPAVNHEGALTFQRSTLGELYSLAVVNFVGQETFYESAEKRDARYNRLVETVAVADWPWLSGMLPWLRAHANLRTASLTGAAHAVHARLAAGLHDGNADLINAVVKRADEVGEFLAYWRATFGPLPKPVRKGLARAVRRLYTARNALKWDSDARGLRFADVLNLIHPKPKDGEQEALWKFLLDERGHRDGNVESVPLVHNRRRWYASDDAVKLSLLADGSAFQHAGLTWENALSELKDRVGEKAVWEAVTPHLPYMAALRNLRSIDQAGVSYATALKLAARLTDPEEVASSRQLPFRFLTAYLAAPSDRWKGALEEAINHSLASMPRLPGRTLVLVDTSQSMVNNRISKKSTINSATGAALFGAALAQRNPGRVDLYGFADFPFRHEIPAGQGVLSAANALVARTLEAGYGTRMTQSIRQTFDRHDRIIIISDMQCFADSTGHALRDGDGRGWNHTPVPVPVPDSVKVYGMNLGGNSTTAIDTRVKNRFEFSGLTDQVFAQILHLEAGRAEKWPWLA